jgi:outer membrane receptor protein involved in Fe transport
LAQNAPVRFDLAPGAVVGVVANLAVQAHVSVSIDGADACDRSPGLAGRFRPPEALARVLAGTGCGFRIVDARTFIVFRARAPRVRRPAPAIAVVVAPPPGALQELVITAARRPMLLARAPYSASVIDGAALEAAEVRDIGDVAPMAAGLATTDLGPGRDKLFLRGLSDGPLTGETQATVGAYVDGVRITYNAPDPDLKLVDVDQVEIVRGPQGALYGAGSIGGLVQIVTRKPDLDAWSASIDASASATWRGAPGWSTDGVINLPLAPGRLAVRLVGYDETQGGYITDVNLVRRDANQVTRSGARGELEWQASPEWTIAATALWQSINSADTHYAVPSVGPLARDVFLQEPHDNDFLELGLRVDGRTRLGDLTLNSSVIRHQFTSRYDATLALPLFAPGAPLAPSPFDENVGTQAVVNELSLASPDSGRFRWLFGLFQSLYDDDLTSTLSTPAPTPVYRQARSDSIGEFAAYGVLTYQLSPALSLSLGGRWFDYDVSTRATTQQPLAGLSSVFAGATRSEGFAPQVTVRLAPTDRLLLYAQVSEGYRAGGFNTAGLVGQAFSPTTAGPEPQRRFAGDELWNYELGAKITLLDGRVQLRTAGFYMVWKGVQSDQLLPNGLPYTANLGDGRDFGGEAEADIRLGGGWRLQANAIANEPELTHPNPAFVAAPDNALPGASTFMGAASLGYERSLGHDRLLRLQGAYAYVGSSRLMLNATTSAAMGDYGFGRLSAALVDRRWTLSLFVRAPLSGLGDTFAFGNPFTYADFPQTTPQRPTTVTLQLARSFP